LGEICLRPTAFLEGVPDALFPGNSEGNQLAFRLWLRTRARPFAAHLNGRLQHVKHSVGLDILRSVRLNRNMDLGTRIAAWRKAKGLTQRTLADAAGVTVAAVSQWESGGKHHCLPSQSSLSAVVERLGVTMEQFYGRIPRRRAS
jgi:DNA-binding XRE family transcriptional regulator